MFICSYKDSKGKSHLSSINEDQVLVVTKIREIETHHFIKDTEGDYSVIGHGFEVVEEKPYCRDHSSLGKPQLVDSAMRKHTFKKPKKKDERRTKRN